MYNYLIGKIVEKGENCIVFECNNIGYDVFVSSFALESLKNITEEFKLLTYYQVKEDGVNLFGFLEKQEKDLFLKLIEVSGVGPKGAMGILSGMRPEDLVKIIALQDLKALGKVKGVGKKTAERILVELKDKVDATFSGGGTQVGLTIKTEASDDAITALVSLGLTKNDATKLVNLYATNDMTTQDIVTICLKNMGRS